jgi:hypothetical protein
MTELNYQELAKQGNPQAIASLLEANLQSKDITIAVNLNGDCLDIIFESDQIPGAQDKFVEFVRSELTDLQPDSINKVKVEGRETGQIATVWSQEFSWDGSIFSQQPLAEEVVPNTTVANRSNHMETTSKIEEKQPELAGFENRLRSTLIVVGMVTGILAIAVVIFVNKELNRSATNLEQTPDKTATFTTAPDTFREAVNSAVVATELGRSAKTKQDWALVADRWQEAVSLMRRVPVSSPNHQTAQTKVIEYQKYLVYAQESAVNPPLLTPNTETADKETSEKANSKKSSSEIEKPEKVNSKKSNSEVEKPEKANSKKSNSETEKPGKVTSDESNPQKSNSSTTNLEKKN